jgi:restriction system protein
LGAGGVSSAVVVEGEVSGRGEFGAVGLIVKKGMNIFKGWIGEKKTKFYLWLALRKKTYHRFHNIILPSNNGTTQIDHLVISIFGLFIVETKNKKGWIFGTADQPNWVQVIFGKKYAFQNPLRQVFRQKKVLSEFLNLDESKIHTVVYFVGDCKFKTSLPDNVIRSRIGRFIKKYRTQILSTEEVSHINQVIKKHLKQSSLSNRDHVWSLRERHSSNTICPRCGGSLMGRMAKQGDYAGAKFLGCENYPRCRFKKKV